VIDDDTQHVQFTSDEIEWFTTASGIKEYWSDLSSNCNYFSAQGIPLGKVDTDGNNPIDILMDFHLEGNNNSGLYEVFTIVYDPASVDLTTAQSNKTYVEARATANMTIPTGANTLPVVAGYQLVNGDKILCDSQTTASQDNIYTVSSTGAWTPFWTNGTVVTGKQVIVKTGTSGAGSGNGAGDTCTLTGTVGTGITSVAVPLQNLSKLNYTRYLAGRFDWKALSTDVSPNIKPKKIRINAAALDSGTRITLTAYKN
jgi:hypothetical protein